MKIRPIGALLLVLPFGFVYLAQPVRAQRVVPGNTLIWHRIVDARPNLVTGRIQSLKGQGIPQVSVILTGTQVGATTDSTGAFSFTAPGSGRWELQINSIGYEDVRDTITVTERYRVEVLAVVAESEGLICGLRVCGGKFGCDDLQITVTDSVTGVAPTATVTLIVEHATGVLTNVVQIRPNDRSRLEGNADVVGLGRRIETAGYHDIEIRIAGYRPWRATRVWLELTRECHPLLLGNRLTARLVPDRPDP